MEWTDKPIKTGVWKKSCKSDSDSFAKERWNKILVWYMNCPTDGATGPKLCFVYVSKSDDGP